MEYVFVIAIICVILIIPEYFIRKDLKYNKHSIWLFDMGLIETFKYTKRY